MHLKELNHRSPMRIFERSIHGGLQPGHLGIVAGSPGVGKAAFLTGIGIDRLLHDDKVLHVAVSQTVDHARERYDEIFADLARASNLEERTIAHEAMERKRIIRSFGPTDFSADSFAGTLRALETHADFRPDLVLVTGLQMDAPDIVAELDQMLAAAREIGARLWVSATADRIGPNGDWHEVPANVAKLGTLPSIIVRLHSLAGVVRIRLLKDHDHQDVAELDLSLDPTTLLVQGT